MSEGKLPEYWAAKPGRGDHRDVPKDCDFSVPQTSKMVLVPEMQSPISFLQRWADLQCLSHSETEVDVSSQTKQRINMAIQKWRAKRGKRSIFIYISFTVTLPPRSLCANWEHDCNIDYTQGNDSANRALVSIVFRFSVLNHKGLVCKHGEESSKGILTNLMINPL